MRNVELSLQIVECLVESDGSGVSKIARDLDLPKATVHRALQTLQRAGWIEKFGDPPKWRLSFGLLARFWIAAGRSGGLAEVALPVMMRLRDMTSETVLLWIRSGDDVIVLRTFESTHLMRPSFPVGFRMALHRTNAGLAIMSAWSDVEIESYLDKRVEGSPLREEVLARIAECRARGYINISFPTSNDLTGVAVALPEQGDIQASLVIVAPTPRMPPEKVADVGAQLLASRSQIRWL